MCSKNWVISKFSATRPGTFILIPDHKCRHLGSGIMQLRDQAYGLNKKNFVENASSLQSEMSLHQIRTNNISEFFAFLGDNNNIYAHSAFRKVDLFRGYF